MAALSAAFPDGAHAAAHAHAYRHDLLDESFFAVHTPSPGLGDDPHDAVSELFFFTLNERDNDSSTSSGGARSDGRGRRRDQEPMKNVSRERKRAELATLREEAMRLERERNLLFLKHKHRDEFGDADRTEHWKKAAETEQEIRAKAEAENERLVATLYHQLGLSRTLESLLRKRVRVSDEREEVADPREAQAPSQKRLQSETSLGMLHAQFLRDIQRVYKTGIERIFTDSEWPSVAAELGRSMIREVKPDLFSDSSTVEMRETRHVPFEFNRVADATWRCSLEPFAEHGRLLETYGSSKDQIAIKYRAATPGNVDRGDLLTAVMVLQKFVDPDRTTHIWRVMSSSTEDNVDVFERAFSDETGWVIIERVPEGIPGLEPGTAIVRMVAQLTPLWPNGLPCGLRGKQPGPSDFHDLVVEATHDDLLALSDAIGNLLLDESLGL